MRGGGRSGPRARLSERERTKIEGRFGMVLLLLIATVFFSVAAPDGPWAQLVIALVLAVNLGIAMRASGVRPKALPAWLGFAALGASTFVAATQEARAAGGYLAIAALFLTLATMGAIACRLRLHAEISVLTVLGAVRVYVLLGLSFALVYQAVGDLGSRPFFAGQEGGTRSEYTYFSFVTMAKVGYGDLTAQGGLGRALAATEGLLGQLYLVTAVAALVGNLGRARAPGQERNEEAPRDEPRSGR